jgi:RNA polymerase sigma-70 factor (ECF subfamily)
VIASPDLPPEDLTALTHRVRAGDERAFRSLFDALYDPLLRYAFSAVRDASLAEDLVQEAFVRLWDLRESLDVSLPVRAYMYRAVRNLCLNSRRNDGTRRRLLEETVVTETAAVPRASVRPDDALDGAELKARLDAMIDALPPRQREAIRLSRMQGLTHEEVAAAMGCAARTVNNHLVAALATLRQRLAHSGLLVASLAWILT